MKKIIIGLFCLFTMYPGFSQTICQTPSSISRHLYNLKMFKTRLTNVDSLDYYLKIYVHIIRNNDRTGGQSTYAVTNAVDILNNDFKLSHIVFVWDGSIDYIDNTYLYETPANKTSNITFNTNNHQNGIDIYFFPDTNPYNGGLANGIGNSSELLLSGTYWKNPYPSIITSHVISHEMGHVLSLFHTHHGTDPNEREGYDCAELVDGSNSETCGDYIIDTPADPGLYQNVDYITYTWNGSGVDANNDTYNPDVRLIMSYTDIRCMTYFSSLQIEEMRRAIRDLVFLQNSLITKMNPLYNGQTVICDSTLYSIENLPNALNVSWSINNSHFTLSPNGTHCTVTFNDVPQYDEATLTATILKDTITVTTLSKRIVMQGTDMYIEGVQSGIYDENGDIPAVACTFTIPANNGLRRIGNRLSTINRDSLEMTSLPVVFENMRTITIPDNPTYGITEIYGGADIYLDGERLDGMTISFSGDRAPEYLSADGGTMIAFRMPEVSSITDVQGYYYVVLHATSEGGCHDFDLYFKVIPVEGETIGDSEISLYFTDSSVRVDFDAMEWTELPNGMLQPIPWYLRIFRMSTGAQMHYSVNTTDSKTVNTSSWPADVYIVRVNSNGNNYTKKFLKQ